jgi:hypothetical protein
MDERAEMNEELEAGLPGQPLQDFPQEFFGS